MPKITSQSHAHLRLVPALDQTLSIVGHEKSEHNAGSQRNGPYEPVDIPSLLISEGIAKPALAIRSKTTSPNSAVSVLRLVESSRTISPGNKSDVVSIVESDEMSAEARPIYTANVPAVGSMRAVKLTGAYKKPTSHLNLLSFPSNRADTNSTKLDSTGQSVESGLNEGATSHRDEEALKEFEKHLIAEKGLQSLTYDTYAADSLALARFLKPRGRDLVGALPEDLEAFLDGLKKTNANATLLRKVTSLRSLYRFLLIDEYIEIEPTLNLKVTKTTTLKRKSMTEEEVMKMLAPESPLPQDPLKRALFLRDNAIVHSLYGEALRESEAIKMDLDDLRMDSSTVLIHGKGNKERMLPLVQRVEDAMSLYLKEGRGTLKERANSKGGDRGSSS